MTSTEAPTIDLLDPTFWQGNPHEAWTWARSNDPVHLDERSGIHAVTRHADLLHAERTPSIFSSAGSYRLVEEPFEQSMIAQDDPGHLRQRRLVNRRFTPRAVRGYTEEFGATIDELVGAATEAGRLEVVEGLAAQLPSRLTCTLLGVPEERWPDLKSWSERLMRLDTRLQDPAVLEEVIDVNMELFAYVQEAVPERKGCPADDLLSTWVHAQLDGGDMPIEAIYHEFGLFVAGGAETTRTVIAHGLRAFCDHPDQWELLHREPSLIPSAVEEVIRWVTPLNNMFRKVVVDTELGGTPLPAGSRVALVYPSANRDEAVFDDPFRFDVTRDPNPHLSFGYGTHFCIGANFARHELQLLFAEMVRRWTNLRPVTEPDVEPNVFARAVRRFELEFDVR